VLGKILGSGSFGEVYNGKLRGFAVAVKVVKKDASEEQRSQLKREIQALTKLPNHENVGLLSGFCDSPLQFNSN